MASLSQLYPFQMKLISEKDQYIIWSGVLLFNIFGQFGNLNIIYAHYRLKPLRTKYGILITMLVTSQSICLANELVGLIYGVSGMKVIRTCFMIISPGMFMYCVQMALMASISIDLLLSIAFPLHHRSVSKKNYLSILTIPAIIYGAFILITGSILSDESEIKLCIPPLSLSFTLRKCWYFISLVFNFITVIAYVLALTKIYCKYRECELETNGDIEQKAMKSLTVLIVVFLCLRFISTFLANFLVLIGCSNDVIDRAQSYMIFPAMACYSSTFYVCFIRSKEYRRIFWRQIASMLLCCGIKVKADRYGHSSIDDRRRQAQSLLSNTLQTKSQQIQTHTL